MPLFEEALDGRIMTGRQAEKIGLVDGTGSKEDAILQAAHMAGIRANSADEVRLCPVTVLSEEGPVFSASTLISLFSQDSAPSLQYQ